MQSSVTEMMEHMSHANQQLARMLESERHITVRLSEIVQALPDVQPNFGGLSGTLEHTQAIAMSISAYLNSIADFQETIATQLTYIFRELKETDSEE